MKNEVNKCISSTFVGNNWARDDNTYLEKQRQKMINVGIYWFPSARINRINHRGKLDKVEFFNSVCAGFNKAPEECS